MDKIRGTAIAKTEAGQITQAIGATSFPADAIKSVCGGLLAKLNIDLIIPGLLIIDTPGHEAFTTLRKRGGAIADLAILVIDINEGFQPQTDESLNYLKQFKTPFVVAATKIDRILGWRSKEGASFIETLKEQPDSTQDKLEEMIYKLIGQLGERGFQAERVDRIEDFSKQITVVPISGVTGEGLADLLMVLSGIAQRYLEGGLEVKSGEGKGTVLEVKEFRGLGTTLDVILYDGELRKGDFIVIGGEKIVKTRIKALLEPEPLKELRVEKSFKQLDSVSAAAGIKIAASGLENVIAGSPLRAVGDERDVDRAVEEVREEVEEVEIETENVGALLKADTLGSLEALIKSLKETGISIRKAVVGDVAKSDIMEIRALPEPIIFAFGVRVSPDLLKLAQDNRVKVFHSDIIYRLIEDYQEWTKEKKKLSEEEILAMVTRPGQIRILPGYVFRQKNPAVFGVEVLKGVIKPKYRLKRGEEAIGEIKELQLEGENIQEAKAGDKVAVSMRGVIVGKDIKEGDVLENVLTERDFEDLERIRDKLSDDELELLEEMGR